MRTDGSRDSDEPASPPIVRPAGYVEDHPVVRRIGDREFYLGNESAAYPDDHDHAFEYVLTLTDDAHPLTTHHRPLDDGPGNDWSAFEAAVDDARDLYRRDGSVLVHCRGGISRSSTLVATTLAAEEGLGFHDALDAVHDARPEAFPHPALHRLAVVYLAARG